MEFKNLKEALETLEPKERPKAEKKPPDPPPLAEEHYTARRVIGPVVDGDVARERKPPQT